MTAGEGCLPPGAALHQSLVGALGDPQCDALMLDLSRCVEKRANPRALHCLEAGVPVRDI